MKSNLSGIVNDRHRHVIWAVVEEVSAVTPESSVIMQMMPPTNVPAAVIEHEILSAFGGKTGERVLGEQGKSVVGQSSTSKVFNPGAYQEFVPFTEQDLLKLRKLGTLGDLGITGLTGGELNWVDRAAKKLKKRLTSRLAQLGWDAFFTGQYIYQGQTFSFSIPSGNQLTAATDWSVANTGTPFQDLVKLVGQNSVLRKYRNMIKCFVINPKTEADIIQRALESAVITNNNIVSGGINEVAKFMAPGMKPFEVVADVVADETENADGTVTMGTATFLVPDDKVLVVMDFGQGGELLFPEYGQLQITENMNDPSASPGSPAQGIYTFIDEKGLEQRKNPHVDVVAGFNGAPNLMRPNDTIIISV